MEPENTTTALSLDRFDKRGMRNGDRMHDAFERFLPKLQKALQLKEVWVKVVILPDITLQ
jgi:hypothetical protein